MSHMTESRFHVGQRAQMKAIATEDIINTLAEVSGDRNPVHLDEQYVQNTIFKKRIAHGLFCLGMISNLIGTVMPGDGAIFINEVSNYKWPVYIDDEIETVVEITEINYE